MHQRSRSKRPTLFRNFLSQNRMAAFAKLCLNVEGVAAASK